MPDTKISLPPNLSVGSGFADYAAAERIKSEIERVLNDMLSTATFQVNSQQRGVIYRHPLTPQRVTNATALSALTKMGGGEIVYQEDTGDLWYYNLPYLAWQKIGVALP